MEGDGHNLHFLLRDGKPKYIEIMVEKSIYDRLSEYLECGKLKVSNPTEKIQRIYCGDLCYFMPFGEPIEMKFDYSFTPSAAEMMQSANCDGVQYSQLLRDICRQDSVTESNLIVSQEELYDLLVTRGAEASLAMNTTAQATFGKQTPDEALCLLTDEERSALAKIKYLWPRTHICEHHYFLARTKKSNV